MEPPVSLFAGFLLAASFTFIVQCENRATKPKPGEWIIGRLPGDKLNLISWLVDGCFVNGSTTEILTCNFTHSSASHDDSPSEFQSFDGFSNNIFQNQLGAVDTPLLRRVPPVYNDRTYEPVKGNRINPFNASEELMTRSPVCGEEACGSKTGKSAFLVFFGQQVVEEILDAQRPGCPPEYFNIEIPESHDFQKKNPGKTAMPFLRSRYSQATGHSPGNPRQQLNEITPWIDGGLIYGTAKGWADVLRTRKDGTLHPHGQLASHNDEGLFPVRNDIRLPMANPPPPAGHEKYIKDHETAKVNRFYVLGNPRGNENAFLLSFGVLLFRWHNQFATYLHETRPSWSGERVFQESRKWAIATYQQLVAYNWLPEWIGEPLEPYKGYDPSVDPQIEQFFQTAAMRFGHTLVTPGAYLRDYACAGCSPIPFHGLNPHTNFTKFNSTGTVRTCNIYWRPQEPLEMKHESHPCLNFTDTAADGIADIDRLLMGMASQRAEREDNMIVEDLRGRVFGPLEFSRRDLMAINIQRGRDHGTPDYNTAREALGLPRISSIEDYKKFTLTETPDDILQRMVEIHMPGENGTEAEAWANIDVWTGGILETSSRPGPLFRAIIKDQFNRIRNADRFWFENTKWKKPRFDADQIERIKTLTVFDMVVSVTRMREEDIQPNPFSVPYENGTPRNLSPGFKSNCMDPDPDQWHSSSCYKPVFNHTGGRVSNETYKCYHFPQIDSPAQPVENCTDRGTYDYFSGSEVSFILTFVLLGISTIAIGLSLKLLATRRVQKVEAVEAARVFAGHGIRFAANAPPMSAREWLGPKEGTRPVAILINTSGILEVRCSEGVLIRSINISGMEEVQVVLVTDLTHLVIKNEAEYDLVLEFETEFLRRSFMQSLTASSRTEVKTDQQGFKQAMASVITKSVRLARLEAFFRLAFEEKPQTSKKESIDEAENLELTKTEFAEALGMSHTSSFVESMFNLVDLDKNGYISFLEFFTMLVIFKSGNAEDKCRYLFKMYDTDGDGMISYTQLKKMIQSLVEAASAGSSEEENAHLVSEILRSMNYGPTAQIGIKDFERIFLPHAATVGLAGLDFIGRPANQRRNRSQGSTSTDLRRQSYIEIAIRTVENMHESPDSPTAANENANEPQLNEPMEDAAVTKKSPILTWFEIKRLIIFWKTLYTCIVVAIFAERAQYYSVEREHSGLRHIAGYGVTVTRGAASAQMFCYATLLLTMCRNTITHLRETFLHKFIPFDAFVNMHKYIARLGLFFSIIHVVGHAINFYHISTQTADDLTCLFRDYFRQTHVIPKFHYWAFQTVTGLSGILLVILAAVIYIFSTKYARSNAFKLFWITHALYPLWYALILLHGSGRLVQSPLFLNFLFGPLIIFIADKLMTMSRQNVEIPVLQAQLLPSNVTKLKFARPTGFDFKSGQWVRIACTELNPSEFHPFTISSSPHEPFLTVHIRAVGPFTSNIRRVYEAAKPNIYLDGPYGEGHQDWHRFEVSVLVGGGIGVTPFASILRDVAAQSNPRRCKKVYFLWVTRTQKQFEWLVDIIKEVEHHPMISAHVFITQSHNQFDLRTVLLYACEKNFQRSNNRSLFTGLKSKTHFGRPDFVAFLRGVKEAHSRVEKFGVFSCGPPPMSKSVDEACHQINNEGGAEKLTEFQHRSENF